MNQTEYAALMVIEPEDWPAPAVRGSAQEAEYRDCNRQFWPEYIGYAVEPTRVVVDDVNAEIDALSTPRVLAVGSRVRVRPEANYTWAGFGVGTVTGFAAGVHIVDFPGHRGGGFAARDLVGVNTS